MNKLLIIICLLLQAGNSSASNWINVGESEQAVLYIDVDSLKKLKNGNVQVWTMFDTYKPIKTNGGNFYSSIKTLNTYNCKENTKSAGMEILYSGKMGNGETVQKYNSIDPFEPIVPDSLGEKAHKKVCNR